MSHTTCLKTEVAQLLLQLELCFPLGSTCGLQGGAACSQALQQHNRTVSVVFKPHVKGQTYKTNLH